MTKAKADTKFRISAANHPVRWSLLVGLAVGIITFGLTFFGESATDPSKPHDFGFLITLAIVFGVCGSLNLWFDLRRQRKAKEIQAAKLP
jgi:hypothetical protein